MVPYFNIEVDYYKYIYSSLLPFLTDPVSGIPGILPADLNIAAPRLPILNLDHSSNIGELNLYVITTYHTLPYLLLGKNCITISFYKKYTVSKTIGLI